MPYLLIPGGQDGFVQLGQHAHDGQQQGQLVGCGVQHRGLPRALPGLGGRGSGHNVDHVQDVCCARTLVVYELYTYPHTQGAYSNAVLRELRNHKYPSAHAYTHTTHACKRALPCVAVPFLAVTSFRCLPAPFLLQLSALQYCSLHYIAVSHFLNVGLTRTLPSVQYCFVLPSVQYSFVLPSVQYCFVLPSVQY